MKEKIWAILIHLSHNQWGHNEWGEKRYNDLYVNFDEKIWDKIVSDAPKAGFNTIVLDIGDGIQFASHPEISIKNAWSHARVRREIARCREAGITLIPKLNFSATHDSWLGEHEKMISSKIYYHVCRDLIEEVYELFEKPAYFHIGMDEEDECFGAEQNALYSLRTGDFFYRDLRFLMDCVIDCGAKPWIWSCPPFYHPDLYKKYIRPDEAIVSPFYYNAFRPEHWTPVSSRQEYIDHYKQSKYDGMNIEYVEQDPILVRFRENALPLMEEGFVYVPCASTYNRCDWNHMDLMEYFRDNAPDEGVLGFMTAPWFMREMGTEEGYDETFRLFKEAKEAIYGK